MPAPNPLSLPGMPPLPEVPAPETAAAAPGEGATAPAEEGAEAEALATDPEDEFAGEEAASSEAAVAAQPPPAFLEFFNPSGVPYALAVVIGAVVAVRVVDRMAQGLAERVVKRRLIIKHVNTFFAFGAYFLSSLLAATALFRLSTQALFALSGTLAVTVGFALKDVAASFMAGISILTNKPFQVGDRIAFGGFYGEVTEIGLRTVRLVTLDDNLVTIPSNKFLTEAVASANAGALDCMVVMDFHILPSADHKLAKQIVADALMASKYLYLGKPFTVLLSTFVAGGTGRMLVQVRAKAYVYDARHEKTFASDVTERVLSAFREQNIRMPE